jgi:hypothetical protein
MATQLNNARRTFRRLGMSLLLCASLSASGVLAQAPNSNVQPTPDPLMMLMLSQPPIDVHSTVRPLASMEPAFIEPGGQANYRVVFNAMEAAISWPEQLPQVPGLELRAGGRGQVLQPSGTNLQPRTTFLYRALPQRAGRYTIPEFQVQVYGKPVTIPSASLEVRELPPGLNPKPQLLYLSLAATNLFVGQSVRARLTLPSDTNGFSQSLAYVKFMGDGIVADQSSSQQRIEASSTPAGGPTAANYIYDIFLTPIASGDISVFAQGYTASSRFSGPIVISGGTVTLAGGPPQFTLLDSDPVTLRVRPLPATGVLPGFKGAIGSLRIDPPKLSTNRVQVGQPVKLTVNVRGDGNIARIVPPDPPRNKQWQGFAAPLDPVPAQIQHMQGAIAFHYHFIPVSDEATATPAIPYSFFNPYTESFVNLTIPSVPITVEPAGPAAAPISEDESEPQGEVETLTFADIVSEPGLRGSLTPVQERAWFPVLQLMPALAFLGLVIWDRRRRYYEQHPEVRMKRRARRALRRHRADFQAAVNSGDGSRAVLAGVRGLQAGCAPFFPAEPQALVGAEVLSILPENMRNGVGGEAVRLLFDAANAEAFGGSAISEVSVQHLVEADQVLAWLEERLRL